MRSLNLGILAHVDAGKTSLTERLLYAAGVIDEIGSVDDGSTQTDSLALERRRGITIKSAVVSFAIDDVAVNLIDTPGHPDFIAEVERVLSVLDGAVLVISAVEGVQAQTRVLMRALQRLRVPTLIFVNKIDRAGARYEGVLEAISGKLSPAVMPMGAVSALGTRGASVARSIDDDGLAELLVDHDDTLLSAVFDGGVSSTRLRNGLAEQTRRARTHPVFFGSARTGAGVGELMAALTEFLPAAAGNGDGPVSGTVFKIERGAAGEKIAYVRMRSGAVRARDRLDDAKVTAIDVFDRGSAVRREEVAAGQIGRLYGLADVRIGDAIGEPPEGVEPQFAPPTLETVVVPSSPEDRPAMRIALGRLAEQDPLIDLRQDELRGEISVSLYGEVQKEVIQVTLADEFGVDVTFRETTTICIERPVGVGEAFEIIDTGDNPFLATVGLRVQPGSGLAFEREVELGSMPLTFFKAVEEAVHDTLREGLHGWAVTDVAVAMTRSGYWAKQSSGHAAFMKGMSSTARDFRQLTPLVLMEALRQAGTVVCEPMHRFQLEVPAGALGEVLPFLGRLGGVPDAPSLHGSAYTLEGEIPAARVHELRSQLPGLTRGEGFLESAFDRHQPVRGEAPARARSTVDPLDRVEYIRQVSGRA